MTEDKNFYDELADLEFVNAQEKYREAKMRRQYEQSASFEPVEDSTNQYPFLTEDEQLIRMRSSLKRDRDLDPEAKPPMHKRWGFWLLVIFTTLLLTFMDSRIGAAPTYPEPSICDSFVLDAMITFQRRPTGGFDFKLYMWNEKVFGDNFFLKSYPKFRTNYWKAF